jgi:hypothetical protein
METKRPQSEQLTHHLSLVNGWLRTFVNVHFRALQDYENEREKYARKLMEYASQLELYENKIIEQEETIDRMRK